MKDLCQGLLCGISTASGVFSAWTFGNFPVIHSFNKNSLYFSVSSKQICRTLFDTLAHWSKSIKASSFTLSQNKIWRFFFTYLLHEIWSHKERWDFPTSEALGTGSLFYLLIILSRMCNKSNFSVFLQLFHLWITCLKERLSFRH